jgi:hypothetical protein
MRVLIAEDDPVCCRLPEVTLVKPELTEFGRRKEEAR